MLQLIRIVLGAPFAAIWSLLMRIRRSIYNRNGGKHRCQYPFPVINVGNLSMGGTGKTPHVEYLVRLLQNRYSLAVLSRGYGRKTKGFRFADHTSNSHEIGDEPLQYHKKYPHLPVAVDENRRDGIEKIKQVLPDTQVMLLDDAFQHLRIKAGLNILLTDYNNLYTDDHVMPYGDLRESPSAAKDAEIIIVTKCPSVLSQLHEKTIKEKLNPLPHQKVFFSYTTFLPIVPFNKKAKEQTNEIKSVV
ncbi:MAG: tetraacyldisaccharide 4'-kinase, partial [Bacteroidales bacterium]|nr:tetraacyldisaccharide 4'-kinase [Bacteroidales bacterium]